MAAQFKEETALLHRVISNPDHWIRWTEHAEKRMAEYGHTAEDVIEAMKTGQVIRVDVGEDVVFRVRGRNVDGEKLEVAAAVYERIITIKVVTVI
jgi:hypothetical protein